MAAGFVVFCCSVVVLALPVTSNGNDIPGLFAAYSPGVMSDIWHLSNFPTITEHGYFLSEFLQPPSFDERASVFPRLERSSSFSIRIMNSSWSGLVNTNIVHKGDQLYVQVSAPSSPGQQLYVEACHASFSPNPDDKSGVALIINKGCVASKESTVKFVSRRSDAVNLILRTSSLKSSEVYIHCKVSVSDLGLTSNTKFCNYNKIKSRWVDLSGNTAVCDCCTRSCRSVSEHGYLIGPYNTEVTAVVSTGPLIIKDQQSEMQTTPMALSDTITTKSIPTAKNPSDKRWIMAGASFSKSPTEDPGNGSPWPVQPSFGGGVMVISQGLDGALSMWLPDLMELQLNPVMQLGIGYPENLAAVVDMTLQSDEPFRKQTPENFEKKWEDAEENSAQKSLQQDVTVGEGKAFDSNALAEEELGMWDFKDVVHLHEAEPVVTETMQPQLNHPSQKSDFPPSSPPSPFPDATNNVNPSPNKVPVSSDDDEGEIVFRQAEVVFKKDKGGKLSEPLGYSKLSLTQSADGSSSLNYEEQQKRPSAGKQSFKTPQMELERDGKMKRKNEEQMEQTFKIKDLVSILLDKLRGLWMLW